MKKFLRGNEVAETIKKRDPQWESPYVDVAGSIKTSETFVDWESRAPTWSLRNQPEPVKVECALPPHEDTSKLGLDETVELRTRVVGASEEDPHTSALSAALKTKLGLANPKKPPPTMSPGVELLNRGVKSYRDIRNSPVDTCPSLFHPGVKSMPVCKVADTSEADMKSYGLAALATLAITHPSPRIDATGATGGRGTCTKDHCYGEPSDRTSRVRSQNLPECAKEFSEFFLLTG